MGNAIRSKIRSNVYRIIVVGLIVYLFFSLQAANNKIELLRIENLLQYGMTERQANYYWGDTPMIVKGNDRDMFPRTTRNLIPQGGKLVRYSSISPSSYYLVHFNEDGRIDFLHFWLS